MPLIPKQLRTQLHVALATLLEGAMKFFYAALRLFELGRGRIHLRGQGGRRLNILRLEVVEATALVGCDLLINMPRSVAWDQASAVRGRAELQTERALLEGLALRRLLFCTFPHARTARLRVFRRGANGLHELVLMGNLRRDDGEGEKDTSAAAQAKRYGFSFILSDGILCRIPIDPVSPCLLANLNILSRANRMSVSPSQKKKPAESS